MILEYMKQGRFYGYDDCFPSVNECKYLENNFKCRDHGQLCWQAWHVEKEANELICSTDLINPKVTFLRTLKFTEDSLYWRSFRRSRKQITV